MLSALLNKTSFILPSTISLVPRFQHTNVFCEFLTIVKELQELRPFAVNHDAVVHTPGLPADGVPLPKPAQSDQDNAADNNDSGVDDGDDVP